MANWLHKAVAMVAAIAMAAPNAAVAAAQDATAEHSRASRPIMFSRQMRNWC